MNIRALMRSSANPDDAATERVQLHRRSIARLAAFIPGAVLLTSCSSLERGASMPRALADQATVLGIPNARFWPDTQGEALLHEAMRALERERAAANTANGTDRGLLP